MGAHPPRRRVLAELLVVCDQDFLDKGRMAQQHDGAQDQAHAFVQRMFLIEAFQIIQSNFDDLTPCIHRARQAGDGIVNVK